MPAPRGILYYSGCDVSGYSLAAVANVRALVNAGIPVQWVPLLDMQASRWIAADGNAKPLLRARGTGGHLADLLTLIEQTSRPVAHDTVVAHTVPEFWPSGFQSGKRNIGCTAWETDRAPAHWLPLLRLADCVLVPCRQNRDAFRDSGLQKPIAVVPHIRRHSWHDFGLPEIAAARAELGIPADNRVFYSINAWNPRKGLTELIRAYASAFTQEDRVTLLIKTGTRGLDRGPLYAERPSRELAMQAINAAAAGLQRPLAHVVLHDRELDADGVDLLHALGDVYVSLSHGEGWGLGAFEAATLAKPVVMTGWGGHTDFLGSDWPGAVPYRLAPVPLWPPGLPSYFPSQRWAQADILAAAELLRKVFEDPTPAQAAAQRIRERIYQEYSEPVLVGKWLEVLSA